MEFKKLKKKKKRGGGKRELNVKFLIFKISILATKLINKSGSISSVQVTMRHSLDLLVQVIEILIDDVCDI